MSDGSIHIDTKIDSSKLKPSLDSMQSNIKSAISSINKTFATMRDIMQGPVAALGMLKKAFTNIINLSNEMEDAWAKQADAEAILNSTLKATGANSWTSADQIKKMASEFQALTRYSDETTIAMQNVLLGFKNIKGDNFKEASLQIINMATVMKMDLASAAQAVGKALDDPIEGINSLTRQGFRFSDQQKEMLKSMVETGDIAKAQKIILDELATTYGGAAEASAKTADGIKVKLKNAIGDSNEQIGRYISESLIPTRSAFTKIAEAITVALTKVNEYREATKADKKGTATLEQRLLILNKEKQGYVDLLKQYGLTAESAKKASNDIARSAASEIELIDKRIAGIIKVQQLQSMATREAEKEAEELAKKQKKEDEAAQRRSEIYEKIIETLDKEKTAYQVLQEQIDLYNSIKYDAGSKEEEERIKAIDALIKKQKELYDIGINIPEITFGGIVGQTLDLSNLFAVDFGGIDDKADITVSEFINEFKNKISSFGYVAKTSAKIYVDNFSKAIKGLAKNPAKIFTDEFSIIKNKIKDIGKMSVKDFLGTFENISRDVKKIVENIVSAFQKSFSIAKGVFSTIGNIFSGISELIKIDPKELLNSLDEILNDITTFFSTTLGSLPYYASAGALLIQNFLSGMQQNLPTILTTMNNVINNILKLIVDNGPSIISNVVSVLVSIVEVILNNAGEILNAGLVLMIALVNSISDNAPALLEAMGKAVGDLILVIANNLPEIIKAAINLFLGLVIGLTTALPQILDAITTALPQMVDAIIEAIPLIIDALVESTPLLINAVIQIGVALVALMPEIMVSLAKSIIENFPEIITALAKGVASMIAYLTVGGFADILSAGINLVGGFIKGFKSVDIWKSIKKIFKGFIDSIKKFFGIHSPSKVFAEFGENIILGLIEGMIDAGGALWSNVSSIFMSLYDNITGVFKGIGQWFSGIFNFTFGGSLWANVSSIFYSLYNNIIGIFKTLYNNITNIFKDIGSWFADVFNFTFGGELWSNVSATFIALYDNITGMFSGIGSWFADVFNFTFGGELWSNVSATFIALYDNITGMFSGIGSWFADRFNFTFGEKLWSNVSSIFKTLYKNITGVFSGIKDWWSNLFDGWAAVIKAPINAIIGMFRTVLQALNKISFSIPDWVPGIGGNSFGINLPLPDYILANGTNNFKGGLAYINDQNAGVDGAELVTLPNGSKVATATATEGMLNLGIQSILSGLSSMIQPALSSANAGMTSISLNIKPVPVYIGEREITQIVFENLDKVVR